MKRRTLYRIRHAAGVEGNIWEDYHENSKLGRFDQMVADSFIHDRMEKYVQALDYGRLFEVKLPDKIKDVGMPLGQAVSQRVTSRHFSNEPLAFADAAAILHYAYGINRDNKDTEYSRPFRNSPSAGALYPLDIFIHATAIEGLEKGIYHYNLLTNSLRFFDSGNREKDLHRIVVQEELLPAGMMIFITAQFERTLFKYKDRGYRFVLLDAGHLAQNINLVATALGLGCVNIGGYYDREADELLSLDGLTQSTIYMTAVGVKGGGESMNVCESPRDRA